MDKSLIINRIKEHYGFKSDSEFARYLEISAQVLSNWKARNTYDALLIYTKCVEINPEWLLTGKGNMLKKEPFTSENSTDTEILKNKVLQLTEENGTLKETNELLRFKVKVLEENLSEVIYTRPDSTVLKSVVEREPELIKGKKK